MDVTKYAQAFYESGHYGGDTVANAFDGNLSSKWEGTADNSWICFDLGSGYSAEVETLRLKPRSYSGAQCKDFLLYGSNDSTNGVNGTWDLLLTGQHGNNENFEDFSVPTPASYRLYKVLVDTSWRGDFAGGSFYEVEALAAVYAVAGLIPPGYTTADFIPSSPMTSGNVPSPYIAGGSDNDAHQAPWMCFDSDLGNFYYCDSGQSVNYLMLDCGEGVAVSKYFYRQSAGGAAANMASQFTLKGSDDGVNWATIDTRAGLSTNRTLWQEFELSAPVTYRYYRWDNIFAQGFQQTCLGEFKLVKATADPPIAVRRRMAQFI